MNIIPPKNVHNNKLLYYFFLVFSAAFLNLHKLSIFIGKSNTLLRNDPCRMIKKTELTSEFEY